MKKGYVTYFSRLASIFLLAIVLFIVANSVVNRHVHVLSNGMVVEHSHPFGDDGGDSSSTASHKHTKFDMYHFNLLSCFFLSQSLVYEVILDEKNIFFQESVEKIFSYYYLTTSNKSPPFYSFI